MSNIKKIITINKRGIIFLFLILLIGLLLIYGVQGKSNPWDSCSIHSNYGDWSVSNIITIITHGNPANGANFTVSVVNKSDPEVPLSEIDPVNLQKSVIFYNLKSLDKIEKGCKIVMHTSLPLQIIENYVIRTDLAAKCAFIIFNEMNDYILIHEYFYTKNPNSKSYIKVKVVRVNCITDNIGDVRRLIQYYLRQYGNEKQEKIIFYIQCDSLSPNYLFDNK